MLRLYEGTIFSPRPVPKCTLVEIIHRTTVTIPSTEPYLVPVHLCHQMVSDNLCLQEGERSLMTVSYIRTYMSTENRGVLSYREFRGVQITRQEVLESEVYEVAPPFEIEEYFDGTFLFIRLTCLFTNEIGSYRLYGSGDECIECRGSVYRIYPHRGGVSEYTVAGAGFVYRFRPRTPSEYPFRFGYQIESDRIHLSIESKGAALQIECPDPVDAGSHVRSDSSMGGVTMVLDEFVRRGSFLYVDMHRISFHLEFHRHFDH